jgi:hypothetical protein
VAVSVSARAIVSMAAGRKPGPGHNRAAVTMIDLIPDTLVKNLSAGLAVLTSMITPALLISASGTFVLSTSNRLGRVIDRVRTLSDVMEQMMAADQAVELLEDRRDFIFSAIDLQSRRAKFLARALMIFYVATGMFVATSVAIGVVTILGARQTWLPVVLGIGGACLLLTGSIVLILEAKMAIRTLNVETAFLGKLVDFHYKNRIVAD